MQVRVDLVSVRNKKTGREKRVPRKSAQDMTSLDCWKNEWELVRQDTPTPHEVIHFQEAVKSGEDPQPVEQFETEDLSSLSVRVLTDKIEYLTFDELEALKADERVSVRKMVDKELRRRDEKSDNSGK